MHFWFTIRPMFLLFVCAGGGGTIWYIASTIRSFYSANSRLDNCMVFLKIFFLYVCLCRELVRSGPARSLATRRTTQVTAKGSTLTRQTRTAWQPGSRTAVAPTTRTPRCPVPVPARVTRPRRRSHRSNTTLPGRRRKVWIGFHYVSRLDEISRRRWDLLTINNE